MEYNFVVSENTRKLFWKGWGMSMCRYRFGKLDTDLGPDDPSQSSVLEIESG